MLFSGVFQRGTKKNRKGAGGKKGRDISPSFFTFGAFAVKKRTTGC
jgi:hypothetical protein